MPKTSGPDTGVEAMFATGRKRRDSTTQLPAGYTAGGTPGGKGGGMQIGQSGHAELRQAGKSSPSSMSPGPAGRVAKG
jgi:hypothetical protein